MITFAYSYLPVARKISALSALTLFISVILYGTFLLMAVGRAAALEGYQSGTRDIEATLATIESQYLAVERDLMPAAAASYGLVHLSAAEVSYVSAASTLSLRQ